MKQLTLILAALLGLTAAASAQAYRTAPANQQAYQANGVYGIYRNGSYANPYSTQHTAPPIGD